MRFVVKHEFLKYDINIEFKIYKYELLRNVFRKANSLIQSKTMALQEKGFFRHV